MLYTTKHASRTLAWLFALASLATVSHTQARAADCPTCQASFAAPSSALSGRRIIQTAIADFDGDGHLDLAATDLDTNSVLVMRGDGAGNFGAASSFAVGNVPTSLAVGDFNGDTHPDIAVGNGSATSVSVLLNDGEGGFNAASSFNTPTRTNSIAVADFDADSRLDLVAAGGGGCGPEFNCAPNTVTILEGDGAGGFSVTRSFNVGIGSVGLGGGHVAAADFNGDAKPDLVVGVHGFGGSGTFLLLNDGAGGFGSPSTVDTDRFGIFAIGDFNNDSELDIVAQSPFGNVKTYLGDGAGGFSAPVTTVLASNGRFTIAADLNGDGHLDIIYDLTASALGNGAGGFEGAATFNAGMQATSASTGDFDEDGRPDLAVSDGSQTSVGIKILLNRTDCSRPILCLSNATVTEGTGETTDAEVVVTLSFPSADTVTVDFATAEFVAPGFSTADGAKSVADFQPVTGTLTFAPGATSRTIKVPIVGDPNDEFDETFRVVLSNPSNATLDDAPDQSAIPFVTILDDDAAPVPSIGDASVVEGNGGVKQLAFTVTLSTASGKSIGFFTSASTSDGTATAGSDYQARSGIGISFPQGVTTANFVVNINGDELVESDETFFVTLSDPNSPRRRGVGTIIDDDAAVNPTAPFLFTDETGRAIALDSVTFTTGPFSLFDALNFSPDHRTRLMLFARNVGLQPGEDFSALNVMLLETDPNVTPATHQLTVESIAKVAGTEDLFQIIVRLPDGLNEVGDKLVFVSLHNLASNKGFISFQPSATGSP